VAILSCAPAMVESGVHHLTPSPRVYLSLSLHLAVHDVTIPLYTTTLFHDTIHPQHCLYQASQPSHTSSFC